MTNQKDTSSYWQSRAIEAERALEQMTMDRDGAASACERLHEDKKEFATHYERWQEALDNARSSNGSIDIDAMGVMPEAHDRPVYLIRDAVMYEINRRINETPAQSLAEVRAEAGREGYTHGATHITRAALYWHEIKAEADRYAQQIRSGER